MPYIRNIVYTLLISASEFGSVKSRKNVAIIYLFVVSIMQYAAHVLS